MYSKENWQSMAEKEPPFGCVDNFQTSPKLDNLAAFKQRLTPSAPLRPLSKSHPLRWAAILFLRARENQTGTQGSGSGGVGKTLPASPLGLAAAQHRFSTCRVNCRRLIARRYEKTSAAVASGKTFSRRSTVQRRFCCYTLRSPARLLANSARTSSKLSVWPRAHISLVTAASVVMSPP